MINFGDQFVETGSFSPTNNLHDYLCVLILRGQRINLLGQKWDGIFELTFLLANRLIKLDEWACGWWRGMKFVHDL